MSQLKNTLKNINLNSNDPLYQSNKKYLNELEYQLGIIINHLNNISIINLNKYYVDNILKQTNLTDTITVSFLNTSKSQHKKLCQIFGENLDNIKLLKGVIPNYKNVDINELKEITDEYISFHNNIISQINQYNKYYSGYYQNISNLITYIDNIIKLFKNIQNSNDEITFDTFKNIITHSYSTNSDTSALVNISNNFDNFLNCIKNSILNDNYESSIKKLEKHKEYLNKQLDKSHEFRQLTKQINNTFLMELKQNSYKNMI